MDEEKTYTIVRDGEESIYPPQGNKEGVWVVYDYDTRAFPIVVYKEEIEAYRYRETLGYGHVRFLEFGVEWGDF